MMRNIVLGILVLILIAGGVATFMVSQNRTPEARRMGLAREFLTVLPDSLGDDHRQEIVKLFETLWYRHDHGLVAQADVDTIMTTMQYYIDAGAITGTELVYYMAEVGYKTYSGEERYRMPGGMVDHPVLNPQSAMVSLTPDTTGYAEWLAEHERQMQLEAEQGEDEDTGER